MDKYEQISVVGEGSYGLVMKCRHKETDQLVAIKKFLETEEDAIIRKMALREIRMLKKLKHENLVAMLEVFRHKKRFYLVFEYMEGTVLDELEKLPNGLGDEKCRERIFQVIRAVNYCHSNNIIHRDVKPENVLVSCKGVVKLCDFGFARIVTSSGEPCTEYVATRWYRAPELLVGDANYGPAVDIWAIGCLFSEIMTGDPLFPGESDIDQLYLIVKMLGKPCEKHQQIMSKNSQLRAIIKTQSLNNDKNIFKIFSNWPLKTIDFLNVCIKMDPNNRFTTNELLKHNYFVHDKFPQKFLPNLREKVNAEFNENPLLRRFKTEILMSTDQDKKQQKRWSSNNNVPVRWKINYDNSIKRKLDQEIEKNLISLTKTSQRLNVIPKMNKNKNNIEKSIENLNKLNDNRPVSEKNSPLSSSPPQFQSLQQYGNNNIINNNTNNNVLHPTINNISFTKDISKKIANIQNNNNNNNNKHEPQINTKMDFLKKLERNVVVDNIIVTTGNIETGLWFTIPKKTNNKPEKEKRFDNFTLPNLPGVTGNSPIKNYKKKSITDTDTSSTSSVTPRIKSSNSQKFSPSFNKNLNNFFQM